MTSLASMIKRVPADGIFLKKVPDMFTRHVSKPKFRGIASFGESEEVKVLLEVADTPELREKGLMGRTNLLPCCGMLFTDLEGGAFWMKGCKIPLDIVFIDELGVVSRVYTMLADGGIKKYYYDDEKYAIELPAGFCRDHGITVGTVCDWRTWK